MLCSIYRITNKITGKMYIGQTWNTILQRWFDHKKPSGKRCVKLHRAIMKYGANSFTLELLTICGTQDTADYWEIFFIEKFDSIEVGYNIRSGGSRGKMSEEQKRAVGDFHRGKTISKEQRKKISIALSGPKHHHYGIPTWNKGIPRTDAEKDAMSSARRTFTDEQVQAIQNDKRTLGAIAKDYEVGTSTIHRIKSGATRYSQTNRQVS